MFNGEFKIVAEEGVVVFAQKAHGRIVASSAKVMNGEPFNVGVGQLIAMKRNEIKIRKADIEEMRKVVNVCEHFSEDCFEGTGHKLFTNFKQITCEKISASLNHIKELKQDLNDLYVGTYSELPEEVKNGTKMYKIVNGSSVLVDNIY